MSAHSPEDAILAAYARYDGDQRVDGIDDYQAFREAVLPLLAASPATPDPATFAGGLFEALAAVQHEIWASWQSYLHSKGHRENDGHGHLRLPGGYVDSLERQIRTPYAELTEEEKNGDREQVRKFWPLIEGLL